MSALVSYLTSNFPRLLDEAPYFPRCSDDKTARLVKPRNLAFNLPYIQVNRKDMVSWLVFDIDEHSNMWIWEDAGLPPPNLIVRDKDKGTGHIFYAITPVCTSINAKPKPIAYMQRIVRAMRLLLKADLSYSGPVAKTPFNGRWQTTELHTSEYSLGDLADFIDSNLLESEYSKFKNVSLDDVSHSRNEILFFKGRHYAYTIVDKYRKTSTFERYFDHILLYLRNTNNFKSQGFSYDLAFSEVMATTRSITRWTWDKYYGRNDCQRGVMDLPSDLTLAEKQSAAAKYAHKKRSEGTLSKIKAAYASLIKKDMRITQSSLAARCGLSRQTIAKYIDEVKGTSVLASKALKRPIQSITTLFKNATEKQKKDSLNNVQNVNYAVHQIPSYSLSNYFNVLKRSMNVEVDLRSVRFNRLTGDRDSYW